MHFRRITSIYQPKNAHIISYKTNLKHFKTLRHVSVLSGHHKGALCLAKVILRYSQFNSYLQTRCCGSISCCVGMCCGAVARCASYDAHLATALYSLYSTIKIMHGPINIRHTTCFGQSFRPSSGVQDCTYSNRHLSNRYCCMHNLELLMMEGKTARNM